MIKYKITHTLFEGGWMEPIEREIFERGHAAAVLTYDPDINRLLLIEQFRPGAMHEKDPWQIELIAGIVEDNEQPEDVIWREAKEEADVELTQVRLIQDYLVSPGGTTEKIHLYYAEADLTQAGGFHGLHDEGEDIRVELISPDRLFEMIDSGSISNAMTLIAGWWFREHYRQGSL